jgi:hypothetical protein
MRFNQRMSSECIRTCVQMQIASPVSEFTSVQLCFPPELRRIPKLVILMVNWVT